MLKHSTTNWNAYKKRSLEGENRLLLFTDIGSHWTDEEQHILPFVNSAEVSDTVRQEIEAIRNDVLTDCVAILNTVTDFDDLKDAFDDIRETGRDEIRIILDDAGVLSPRAARISDKEIEEYIAGRASVLSDATPTNISLDSEYESTNTLTNEGKVAVSEILSEVRTKSIALFESILKEPSTADAAEFAALQAKKDTARDEIEKVLKLENIRKYGSADATTRRAVLPTVLHLNNPNFYTPEGAEETDTIQVNYNAIQSITDRLELVQELDQFHTETDPAIKAALQATAEQKATQAGFSAEQMESLFKNPVVLLLGIRGILQKINTVDIVDPINQFPSLAELGAELQACITPTEYRDLISGNLSFREIKQLIDDNYNDTARAAVNTRQQDRLKNVVRSTLNTARFSDEQVEAIIKNPEHAKDIATGNLEVQLQEQDVSILPADDPLHMGFDGIPDRFIFTKRMNATNLTTAQKKALLESLDPELLAHAESLGIDMFAPSDETKKLAQDSLNVLTETIEAGEGRLEDSIAQQLTDISAEISTIQTKAQAMQNAIKIGRLKLEGQTAANFANDLKSVEKFDELRSLIFEFINSLIGPEDFKNRYTALMQEEGLAEVSALFGNVGEDIYAICEDRGYAATWQTGNESDRFLRAADIEALFPGLLKLNEFLKSNLQIWGKSLDKVHGVARDNLNMTEADTSNLIQESLYSRIKNSFHYVSIYDGIQAGKLIIETLKNSFNRNSRQGQNVLLGLYSKAAAKAPIGWVRDTELDIQAKIKRDDNEVIDNFEKEYNDKSPGFIDLFGPGGEFSKQFNNRFRTSAILKYAAANGWLYGIESADENTVIAGSFRMIDIFPQRDAAKGWLLYFQGENRAGSTKRQETAYNRTKPINNQDVIQGKLQEALQAADLPSVIGIARAAQDRGKAPAVNQRTLIAFMRALQNPTYGQILRNSIDVSYLADLGKHNMATVSVGFGMLNLTRKDVNAAAKATGEYDMNASLPGRLIQTAENLITDADPELKKSNNQKELDKLIALLIAGKHVEVGPEGREKVLTIWNEKFDFYRKHKVVTALPGDSREEMDYDYFVEASGQLMMNPKIYSSILSTDAVGGFVKNDNAQAFLKKLLEFDRDMRKDMFTRPPKISRQEFLNAHLHMRSALTKYYNSELQNMRAFKLIDAKDPVNPSKYLVQTLLEMDLVDPTVFTRSTSGIHKSVVPKLGYESNEEFEEAYVRPPTLYIKDEPEEEQAEAA